MADNSVFISGTTSGAFAEAFSGLPPWATQKTAELMLSTLNKSYDTQKAILEALKGLGTAGTGNTTNEEDFKKLDEELKKFTKNLKDENEELDKLNKRLKEENEENEKKKKLNKDQLDTGKIFNAVLGGLVAMGTRFTKVGEEYIKTYNGLFESGVNVLNGNNSTRDGMEALNQTVRLTGLRLETLMEVSQKYSSAVNSIGFTKFAKSTSLATTELSKFGYTSKQSAELVAAYTDMESNYTNMQGRSAAEIARGTAKFGEQITRTSLALGISREQLVSNAQALAKSTSMSTIAAEYGEDAAKNVKNALMGLDPTTAAKFSDMIADAGAGMGNMNETIMGMRESSNLYASQIQQMAQDTIKLNPEEFRNKWKAIVNDPAFNAEQIRMRSLAASKSSVSAQARASEEAMAVMRNYANRISEPTDQQVDAAMKTKEATANLATQMESLSASLQKAWHPSIEQINLLTEGLTDLNHVIENSIDLLSDSVRVKIGGILIAAGFIAAGLLFVNRQIKFVGDLFNIEGKAAAKSAGNLFSSMGNFYRNAMDTLNSPIKKIGSVIEGLGGPLAKLGFQATLLAGSFYAGYQIGSYIYDHWLENSSKFIDLIDKIGNALSWFTGTKVYESKVPMTQQIKPSEKAKAEMRERGMYSTQPNSPKPSGPAGVTKNPAPTTVDSPSNSKTSSADGKENDTSATTMPEAVATTATIPKPTDNGNINTTLEYQSILLNQVVTGINQLVSVNKDILKYTRVHT